MDLTLSDGQLELQGRARAFTREVLQPLEGEFEQAGGRLPGAAKARIREASVSAGLVGGSLPREVGGQGWTMLEQVLVHEQLGQSTGGLWSFIPGAYNALIHCSPEQRARYLDPSLTRRALRELRRHRARRRVRCPRPRRDGGPRRRHRGVRAQRREMVRDRAPGRDRLHDLPLPRRGWRSSGCRRCSSWITTRPA